MNIEIRECDDWVAVYKDGHLVEQNHSVSLTRGLDALGIDFTHDYFDDDEMDFDTGTLKDGAEAFPVNL